MNNNKLHKKKKQTNKQKQEKKEEEKEEKDSKVLLPYSSTCNKLTKQYNQIVLRWEGCNFSY